MKSKSGAFSMGGVIAYGAYSPVFEDRTDVYNHGDTNYTHQNERIHKP